jgi:hypothetical protein
MLISLAGNIYQFVKGERLARDLALMQLNVKRQFAEIRELESGALEQNLRRLDGLNRQVDEITAATLQQARSEVRRNRSDLTKALERKQKEMARQMSELKSDVRRDASPQVSVSNNFEKPPVEAQPVMDDRINSSASPTHSKETATTTPAPVVQAEPVEEPKKTRLWSKLNPLKWHKKKSDSASR